MKHISRIVSAASLCLALVTTSKLNAQQLDAPSTNSLNVATDNEGGGGTLVTAVSTQPSHPAWESSVDRWLDLNTFNYATRYRSTFDLNGAHTFDQGQQHLVADGKFKFDEAGKYGIGFHLSSGRYFNWSYADFIGGGQHQFVNNSVARMTPFEQYIFTISATPNGFYNSGGGQIYLRQLFLSAEPVRGVEMQYGGFAINHGVNTEATSYDDDGYMSGERITLRRPKQLWASEISYTRGYLGDLYNPNFFSRGDRLSRSNYWQILGRKDFGKRVAVSADYTFTRPEGATFFLKTTREAVLVNTRWSKALDQVRFESYQRINSGFYSAGAFPFKAGQGYALTLSRDFRKKFGIEAGLADVDAEYTTNLGVNAQAIIMGLSVNGDQYGVGKRYFVRPSIPLGHSLSMVGAYSHTYADPVTSSGAVDVWNARSLTAGFQYDIRNALFHEAKTK